MRGLFGGIIDKTEMNEAAGLFYPAGFLLWV